MAKTILEEERSRLTAAQDTRDKLSSEAAQLRAEKRQLQDLRDTVSSLQEETDKAELAKVAIVQRESMLKSERERLEDEVSRAKKLSENTLKELEEIQAKVQRQQELSEQLNVQRTV